MENKLRAVLKRLVEAKRRVYLVEENPGTDEEWGAAHAEYAAIKELIALIYDVKVSVIYVSNDYDQVLDAIVVRNFITSEIMYWEYYEK